MENSIGKKLAISLLVGTNTTHYAKIRNDILETFKLDNHCVPTYWYMTKHCPRLESGIMNIHPAYSILTREYELKKEKRSDLSETKKIRLLKIMVLG